MGRCPRPRTGRGDWGGVGGEGGITKKGKGQKSRKKKEGKKKKDTNGGAPEDRPSDNWPLYTACGYESVAGSDRHASGRCAIKDMCTQYGYDHDNTPEDVSDFVSAAVFFSARVTSQSMM